MTTNHQALSGHPSVIGIDPRGPQFNAMLTSLVLALSLIAAPGPVGVALLGVQAALFAVAVALGVQRTPAAYLFRAFVRPRLAPSAHLEDPAPPRFAQGIGLVFAVVGLVGYLVGAPLVGAVATGFALAAALLNAAFGLCLGCEMYLLFRRIAPRNTPTTEPASTSVNSSGTSANRAENTKEEEAVA